MEYFTVPKFGDFGSVVFHIFASTKCGTTRWERFLSDLKSSNFNTKFPLYTLLCIKIHHITTDKQFIKVA